MPAELGACCILLFILIRFNKINVYFSALTVLQTNFINDLFGPMIHESCSFPIHMHAADTDALSGAGILKGNKT